MATLLSASRWFGAVLTSAALVATLARAQSYTFVPFTPPGGGSPFEFAINDRGDVVGATRSDGGLGDRIGFLYSEGRFSTFSVPGATSTLPQGINSAGQIVGVYGSPTGLHAFLYADGVFSTLPWSGHSINDYGLIAGSVRPPNGLEYGVVYDLAGTTFRIVADPEGVYTDIYGINNAGQVIGRSSSRAFLYDLASGTFTTLAPPGYESGWVYGINSLGQIVGTSGRAIDDANPVRGFSFIYDNGVYHALPIPDGTFATPHGINSAGQIVGRGSVTNSEFFFATPVATSIPEPSTFALLLTGGAVMVGWGVRRRLGTAGSGLRS